MRVENLSERNSKSDVSFTKKCPVIRLEHSYFRGFVAVAKKKIRYVTQSCRTRTQCHVRSALLSCTTLLRGLNVKYLAFLFPKTFLIIPLFKFVYFED